MTIIATRRMGTTQRAAADIARAQREHGLPGRRSGAAIYALRKAREANRPAPAARSLRERFHDKLVEIYSSEINRRGGETSIDGVALTVVDRAHGLNLLHADGSRRYTLSRAYFVQLSYLCGAEAGQRWAVRVPGTITTVADALVWMTPAAVKTAVQQGRKVARQGDVFIVETTSRYDGRGELPERHVWDAAARVLRHPEHPELRFPYPVRFVAQRALGMGRGWGTTSVYAD